MFLSRISRRLVAHRHFHRTARCLRDDDNDWDLAKKYKKPDDWKVTDISQMDLNPIEESPISRTHRILKNDVLGMKKYIPIVNEKSWTENAAMFKHTILGGGDGYPKDEIFPNHVDVVIIGGGAIGSSIAYFLKERARHGLRIAVIEKDLTYEKASTTLSVGGLRQQFSLEENILMSLYAADFFRDIKLHLGDHVDVNFVPHGYLFLATEEGAQQLQDNSILQNRLGAKNVILTKKKLKARFPWLNVDDIELGCFGVEKEGWFDPWSLLTGLKHKAQSMEVDFVEGEVMKFEFELSDDIVIQGVPEGLYNRTNDLIVKQTDGTIQRITFATAIVAAGAWSGEVAEMLGIGRGDGMMSVGLPVVPRKRYVYTVKTQGDQAPLFHSPLTIDPKTSTYFRCDGIGGNYLVGRSPSLEDEPSCDNLDVDYNYFDEMIWPHLAHRVPAFESAKVVSAWSGFYEFNTFDENGIVGQHPYHQNVYFATGFSGHGIQQAPAVGRAIAELIMDDRYVTIDLTRLGWDRLMVRERMQERNIV